MRVLFAAGGTAGHIEPALTLADALRVRRPGVDIAFLGGERGLETTLVPQRGYPLHTVPAVAFPRALTASALAFPARMLQATRAATAIAAGSDVIVGFGGYPAVPGYLAARRLGIPLIIHEANAKAGLANRLASHWARAAFVSYPGALRHATWCPLPLRPSLVGLDRAALRPSAQATFGVHGPTVLVFGGSQGAQRLNAALNEALPALLTHGYGVIHAYGAKNPSPPAQPNYCPLPYIADMAAAYAAADVVVCRAGAMTCTEIAAVGIPAVLVPLPIGNGEQRWNAEPLVEAGGAVMVPDAQLTAQRLVEQIRSILTEPGRLTSMSHAMARRGASGGADRLVEAVLSVAQTSAGVDD